MMKKTILCVAISLVILLPVWGQNEPRICPGWAKLLNVVPGFGVGSFIQGDLNGGMIQLFAEGIGWGWIIGCVMVGNAKEREAGPGMEAGGAYYMMVPLGVLPLLFGLGFGCGRVSRYDQQKHREEKVTIGISPSITPSAGHQGFDVGIELAVRYAIEQSRFSGPFARLPVAQTLIY
jgi:hypothetical protein